VNLARQKLERDVVQHLNAGKRFSEVAGFEEPIHTALLSDEARTKGIGEGSRIFSILEGTDLSNGFPPAEPSELRTDFERGEVLMSNLPGSPVIDEDERRTCFLVKGVGSGPEI